MSDAPVPPPHASPPPADGAPPDWEAIARHLDGSDDASDHRSVEQWLAAHPADAALVQALDATLDRYARAAVDAAPVDVHAALAQVTARRMTESAGPSDTPILTLSRGTPGASRPSRRWLGAAVGLAAAAAVAVVVSRRSADRADASAYVAAPTRHQTGVGQRDSLRLTDGTRVLLAPGTTLSVASRYGETERAVSIDGEAWFDVVHDDRRPFTVRARHAVVRDIGTQFTVQSHDAAPVRVVVTQGAVAIRAADGQDEVRLTAGDVATIPQTGQATIARGAATDDDTAWLQERLVFREAPLPEVTAALSRWYGIRLVVDDSTVAQRHLTATFAGEPRERVLELLALALGATLEQRGDTAILRAERR
ncbi:MAG: FecR domain-containing protein [Gemmatimonadaceae bacterium]|nr:FecR domain-containing protein [Gemmatimonadaceae bacterium]